MINISIPGFGDLQLNYIVSDYNGTLLPGVGKLLSELSNHLEIHVITADTFGLAASQLAELPVKLKITPLDEQAEAKLAFVRQLGAEKVIAFGNGRNDQLMLKAAGIGIALIQREGGSPQTFASADAISTDILEALDLLNNPKRLIATLRS